MSDKATLTRDKVLAILGEAKRAAPRAKTPLSGHSVVGNHNVIGDGNTIVITHQVVEGPNVSAKPGVEHIPGEEAPSIEGLLDLVIALEKVSRNSPLGYRGGLASIYRGDERDTMHADSPIEEARRGRLAYITRVVDGRGWRAAWDAWLAREFGGRSLADLNSDELWLAYQRVAKMLADDEPGRAL